MAARVALLILATGMFAALWSGDHPDQLATIDRPAKILVGQRTNDRGTRALDVQRSAGESGWNRNSSMPGSNDRRMYAPFPEGISAGTFLVVDHVGRTQVRVVSDHDAVLDGKSRRPIVADHYSVEVGGMRWHYIRIESNLPDQNSVSSIDAGNPVTIDE